MTDTAPEPLNREKIARCMERLANNAEGYARYLGEHTDYWEGGGSPMEGHYELLNEADHLVKKLRQI